jgi:hypothetical protein
LDGRWPLDVFAARFIAAAEEALDRIGVYEERIGPAGLRIKLRFAGEDLRDRMMRAFEHVRLPADAETDLEVTVWDSVQSGVDVPIEDGPLAAYDKRGATLYRREGPYLALSNMFTLGLNLIDTRTNTAYSWLRDGANLSEGDRSVPLRALMSYWLADAGGTPVHGAALGSPWGAVLLMGDSGSGKSTTSLACAEAGFEYMADDFSAVSFEGDGVTVHSLYCSAKIFAHNLPKLPAFAAIVANPGQLETEKAVGFLTERGAVNSRSMAVKAAVVLASKAAGPPSIKRISPAKAFLALAPNTAVYFAELGSEQLAKLRMLVSRVPCYEMQLSDDLEANPEALRALLREIAGA